MCEIDRNIESAGAADNSTTASLNGLERWWQKNSLIVSFFFSVLLCCFIYLVAIIVKEKNFEASQKRIIEVYERHIVKTGDKSQQSFIIFQQPQVNQEKFQEEIKSLLELQQSYIQDNFGSFEIWAGILTIVFLVFSFFSLQKSEQMEQQSRDSLKRIKSNMHESASKLSDFDNKASSKLTVIDNEVNSKLTDFESKSSSVAESFKTQSEGQINAFKEQSTLVLGGINEKMEEAKTSILKEGKMLLASEREKASSDFVDKLNLIKDEMISEFENIIESKKTNVDRALLSAQNRLETLLKEIEDLQQTISDAKQNSKEEEDDDEEEALLTDVNDD